jgi:hypothetical protein
MPAEHRKCVSSRLTTSPLTETSPTKKKNLWLNSAHGVYYVSVLEHFMVHYREGKWFSSEEMKGSLFLCVLFGSVQTRSEGDGQFYYLD